MSEKKLKVIADFQILPIGVGISLSKYVAKCERILAEAGLETRLHTMGTNIEGDWDEIMATIRECHDQLHEDGVVRVVTSLKISTRTDREQSITGRIESVENKK